MVPTTVERLREGQGVLERVLRSIKLDRNYKRGDGSSEKESGTKTLKLQGFLLKKYTNHNKNIVKLQSEVRVEQCMLCWS